MEILNIGFGELVVILIIALLVFGPERLPEIARQVGRVMRQVRSMSDDVQRAIMSETSVITKPLEETRREIESTARPVREFQSEIDRNMREVRSAATMGPHPAYQQPQATVARDEGAAPPAQNSATDGNEPMPRAEEANGST
jgi:sec-independent protein translocase protein TatB